MKGIVLGIAGLILIVVSAGLMALDTIPKGIPVLSVFLGVYMAFLGLYGLKL